MQRPTTTMLRPWATVLIRSPVNYKMATYSLEERADAIALPSAGRPAEVVSHRRLAHAGLVRSHCSQDSVYQPCNPPASTRRRLQETCVHCDRAAARVSDGGPPVQATPRRLRSVDIRPASRGRPERCFASRFVFRARRAAIARSHRIDRGVRFLDLNRR